MSGFPFPGIRRPTTPPQTNRSFIGKLYHSWFGTPEQSAIHTSLLTNIALFSAACFTIALFGDIVGEATLGNENPMMAANQTNQSAQGQATL